MSFKRVLLIIIILAVILLAGNFTMAQEFEGWRASKYLNKIAGQPGVDLKVKKSTAEIVGSVLARVVGLLGVVFLILILYAAYGVLTAGGNSEDVRKSLAIIKWSIVGAIVVFGAYAISSYVVNNMKEATRPALPYDIPEDNSDFTEDDEMTDYVDCTSANCTLCGSDATCCNSYPNSNCCVYVDGICRSKEQF